MSAFEELTGRLTRRLRIDPELRMDVTNELRSHLQDTAADFRDAGMEPEQAQEEAIRALGDEKQLAALLWEANRRRIRIRQVAKWTARVALIPAAVLVICMVFLGVAGSFPVLHHSDLGPFPVDNLSHPAYSSPLDDLSEEQRYIFLGDPNARTQLERAKSISDRWPDDPVYYGNYAVRFLGPLWNRPKKGVSPDKLTELLPVFDKGEEIDPENAFYNLTKAAWLIQAACTISEDPTRTYERVNDVGEIKTLHCWRIEIHDRQLFRRGLEEFHRGLTKPLLTGRTFDMLQRRLDVLPKPRRLREYLSRIELQLSLPIPSLNDYRNLEKALSAHAIALAETGQARQAVKLVKSAQQMGAKLGANSPTLIHLFAAQAMYSESLRHTEQVYIALNQPDNADAARAQLEEQVALFNETRRNRKNYDEEVLIRAGALWQVLLPSFSDYEIDFEPIRSAELTVAMQLGLVALLILVVALALLFVVMTGWGFLGSWIKREALPLGVFVGWRQVGRIVLMGIGIPFAAYGCYAYSLMSGDRGYALNYAAGRIILELAVTFAAVVVLLMGLSYSAIRKRAEELRIRVPPALRFRNRRWIALAGALVLLGVGVYLVGWWTGPFKGGWKSDPSIAALVLGGVVTVYVVLRILREFYALLRKPYRRFRKTLYRSLIPILAGAVIVIGALCGGALGWAERSAISRIEGPAALDWTKELERSTFRHLKDRFIHQHEAMTTETR